MAKRAAKDNGVNKSLEIRKLLAKDPDASPKALSEKLAARGIEASAAYVSTIKTAQKSKGGVSRKAAGKGGSMLAATDLMEAKKLVDKVGGIENAEALLGTLKKLI